MSIILLNRQISAGKQIIPNFFAEEFFCNCGKCSNMKISEILLDRLHVLRNLMYKNPIIITSAYRCKEHNKSVGGRPNSWHLYGRAIDIYLPGRFEDHNYFINCCKQLFEFTYTGSRNNQHFIHCDTQDFLKEGED